MPKTLSVLVRSLIGLFLTCASGRLALAQCDSAVIGSQMLPTLSGPTLTDIEVSSDYVYLVTQWGMARGPIQPDGTVGALNLLGIGYTAGHPGLITIHCDCFQGAYTFDVAESDAIPGNARIVSDWGPFGAGGGSPPNPYFSGLPAMLGQTSGSSVVTFGQQIDLPNAVPLGSRLAVIYLGSSQKYFAYLPMEGGGVYRADVTSPTGSADWQDALQSTLVANWNSPDTGVSVRLGSGHVNISSPSGPQDLYLLAGVTPDRVLHIAPIQTDGSLGAEVTTILQAVPAQLTIAAVDDRVFLFSAEGASGTEVSEYVPSFRPGGPSVGHVATISGNSKAVRVSGDGQFPILFVRRYDPSGDAPVDIYDTTWLTKPPPVQPPTQPGIEVSTLGYAGFGFGAHADLNAETAYVYVLAYTSPEQSVTTIKVDISCLMDNPQDPPTSDLSIENSSWVSRGRTGDYYFGDQWTLTDQSRTSPSAPLDLIKWDVNAPSADPSAFSPDGNPADQNDPWQGTWAPRHIRTVVLPCDPSGVGGGGNPLTGENCYESVGSPVPSPDPGSDPGITYYSGVLTHNPNGWSNQAKIRPTDKPIKFPVISISGFDQTSGKLQFLSGSQTNTATANGQGNSDQAIFDWTFAGTSIPCVAPPAPPPNPPCKSVTIPSSATNGSTFSLTVKYLGGYWPSLSGTLDLEDLIPDFAITSSLPALVNTTLNVKNLMRVGNQTTLHRVLWTINGSPNDPIQEGDFPPGQVFYCTNPPPGQQLSSFCAVSGQSSVTTPATQTSPAYLHLGYCSSGPVHPSSDGSCALSFKTSVRFSVNSWTPLPLPSVYVDSSHRTGAPSFGPIYQLTTGTTYYLYDDEPVPSSVTYPGVSFYTSSNSDTHPESLASDHHLDDSTGSGPVSFPVSATCNSGCFLKAAVTYQTQVYVGVVGYVAHSPGSGGGAQLGVSGPGTGVTGAPVTFTAFPSGFSPTSYSWDFGDTAGGGSGSGSGGDCPPGFPGCPTNVTIARPEASVLGTNPMAYTYVNTGTHTVTVTASDGSTARTATTTITISQGGPPTPLASFSASGASLSGSQWQVPINTTITFIADESHAQSWDWDFGDGSAHGSGQAVTHVYDKVASPQVTLVVTGDGTNTVATQVSSSRQYAVIDPNTLALGPSGRYQIQARWSSSAKGTSGVGTAVGLTSDTGYFWFFYPANIEVVVKVLDACGVDGFRWVFAGGLTNLHVELTVTDSATGATRTYTNPEGTAFLPIQDTRFEACPSTAAPAAAAATATVTLAPPSPANAIVGQTVAFSASASGFPGSVAYSWNFGECPLSFPGCDTVSGPLDGSNTHSYSDPGTYTVTVVATSGAVEASATATVTVSGDTIPNPSVDYSVSGASRATPSSPWVAIVGDSVTFQASELHAAAYEWDFSDGLDKGTTQTYSHMFATVGNTTVTLKVTGDGTNTSAVTRTATIQVQVIDPYTLRLDNDRFFVTADWNKGSGASATNGHGNANGLTPDTGSFWFFDSSNTEIIIKVLDACAIDGHFWVFATGLTNVGVTLTVTDSQAGATKTYTNSDGTSFAPIQDFSTFASCGGN